MTQVASEDSIRRIYRETLDGFYGVVSRRCDGDRELTEDVVQETWLRAVRTWQQDGIPEKPMAWLTTVGTRILANHFRRRPTERLDEAAHEMEATDLSYRRERRSLVERALARLPVLQGRLLEAFHLEERAVADIAREHGMSDRAVEGRLRRARQTLRREIDEMNNDEGLLK
jgi:RNA polymerase sigma-70 factor (ECF subfamily)